MKLEFEDMIISPSRLCEICKGGNFYSLAYIQFMCPFSMFIGGDKRLPSKALSESLHNVTYLRSLIFVRPILNYLPKKVHIFTQIILNLE